MTARAAKKDEGRERRCIATGEVRPVEQLVRFVVGPCRTARSEGIREQLNLQVAVFGKLPRLLLIMIALAV